MATVFVIGDVHGEVDKLRDLLRDAGLIDGDGGWTGADSTLWFMGDLVDHGPDGIGAIELIMRLQRQADAVRGRIGVLLGNHDLLLLAGSRFGDERFPGETRTFRDVWEGSGGVSADLERLTPEQSTWLTELPAMVREGSHLLVHADARLYSRYGASIQDVNAAIAAVLHGDDSARWGRLLNEFGEHDAFVKHPRGTAEAERFLERFSGELIVHGHTPIAKMTGQPAETVREPLRYAGGLCLNVDAGMYLGGSGFVYRL